MSQPPETPQTPNYHGKILRFPGPETLNLTSQTVKLREPTAAFFEHFGEQQKYEAMVAILAGLVLMAILSSSVAAYPFMYLLCRENKKRRYHKGLAQYYERQIGQKPRVPGPPDILA